MKIKAVCIALAVLVTTPLTQAQFLDALKDAASKALQKKLDNKPADPATNGGTPIGGGNNNAAAAPSAGQAQPAQSFQAYQSYDFVPGETVLFEDNFEKDDDGEFPSHWNQQDGQGAVNMVAGRKALTLTASDFSHVSPAIKGAQYLGDSWSLEFDTYATDGGPAPRIYLFNQNLVRSPANHSYSDWVGYIYLGKNNWSDLQIRTQTKNSAEDLNVQPANPDFMRKPGFFNQWHHVAVAYREGRLKVYVDQFRVYSLQDFRIRPRALAFGSAGEQSKPGVISNVRVTNGSGIKLVDKKFTDAKIVTHGINFDNDKATLRPESMGTLNMVVDVLKNNPELRFDVQGHTDNTGSAARNQTLSQQRADVVRQQLISMGVSAQRLSAKGLGDTQPMADNATPEGRANNRRVEFVALR